MSTVDPILAREPELGFVDQARKQQWPPISVLVSGVILSIVVIWAITGSLLAPVDPLQQNLTLISSGPTSGHLLGTDELGRDVFSRLIAGARLAILGPAVIAVGVMAIGTVLGVLAGYRGGKLDSAVMRWVDLTWSLPAVLVIIVVAGVLGAGYAVVIALLVVLEAPTATRVVRAAALEQRPRPYVEAAQSLGLAPSTVMRRHILPNVLPVVVANTFLTFSFALVNVAALAFVGIGSEPAKPSWGHMLFAGVATFFQNPWTAIAPALMIIVTAVSVNLIGDWTFEQLSDRGIRT